MSTCTTMFSNRTGWEMKHNTAASVCIHQLAAMVTKLVMTLPSSAWTFQSSLSCNTSMSVSKRRGREVEEVKNDNNAQLAHLWQCQRRVYQHTVSWHWLTAAEWDKVGFQTNLCPEVLSNMRWRVMRGRWDVDKDEMICTHIHITHSLFLFLHLSLSLSLTPCH